MNGPTRLSRQLDDSLVATMLRAAKNEVPEPSAVGKALHTLASAETALGASNSVAVNGVLTHSLVQGGAIGLVIAGAGLGAIEVWGSQVAPPGAATAQAASSTKGGVERRPAQPVPALTSNPAPAHQRGTHAPGKPPVASIPNPRTPEQAPTSPSSAPDARLMREIELIDRARALIATGDAVGAQAELSAYSREVTSGDLAPEAQYLQMEAYALAGNTEAARDVALKLLSAHPDGVHAERARSVIRLAGDQSSTVPGSEISGGTK